MPKLWNKIYNNDIWYHYKHITEPSLQNNIFAIYVCEVNWYPQICQCHIWHIDISMVSITSALHIHELICRRVPGRCVCMRHHLFSCQGDGWDVGGVTAGETVTETAVQDSMEPLNILYKMSGQFPTVLMVILAHWKTIHFSQSKYQPICHNHHYRL